MCPGRCGHAGMPAGARCPIFGHGNEGRAQVGCGTPAGAAGELLVGPLNGCRLLDQKSQNPALTRLEGSVRLFRQVGVR